MKKTTKKSASKGKTDRRPRDLSVKKGHEVKGGVVRRTGGAGALGITGVSISS
jgi:hypothetical protein